MERINGYLDLDKEFVCGVLRRELDEGDITKFLINNVEYYFKPSTVKEQYMELFFENIAALLKIPTVHYDLATFHNRKGVISSSFNSNHLKEIQLLDIIQKYYIEVICENPDDYPNEVFIENSNNLETIWSALEHYYAKNEQKRTIVSQLMSEIIDRFFLQIIAGNMDLHYRNITILEGENIHLSSNYDMEDACSINLDTKENNFCLLPFPLKFSDPNYPIDLIYSFIDNTDLSLIDKFFTLIHTLPPKEIIISKIEAQTNIPVPLEVIETLSIGYEEYLDLLKSKIEERLDTRLR